jgi:hypothetical protein
MSTPATHREPTHAGTTTDQRVARLFGLTGDRWMRHANKWSVWTRFSVLSLIALAIWSREWIGWYCLVPIALALAWMVFNPRLFPEPRSTRNWASKSVLGERIWSERTGVQLPEQFDSPVSNVANAFAGVGILVLAYGLVRLDVLATLCGIVIAHLAKLWYLDRMMLLFDDMKHSRADYAAWDY